MRFSALLILIFLGAFTSTALAQSVAASPDTATLLQQIFDSIAHGQGWAGAATGVVLACALARKYMPAAWTEGTKGDIVGTATAFVMAFAGSIAAHAIAPGATMTMAVFATAAKIGVAANGGYTIIHKVASWLVAWGKLPPWATSVLSLVTALAGSNAVTLAKADAAGAAAVAADPPKGMAGGDTITEVK